MYRNQFKPTISLRLTATAEQKHHRTSMPRCMRTANAERTDEIHVSQSLVCVCVCWRDEYGESRVCERSERGDGTQRLTERAAFGVYIPSIESCICVQRLMCPLQCCCCSRQLANIVHNRMHADRRDVCDRVNTHKHKHKRIQLESMCLAATRHACVCVYFIALLPSTNAQMKNNARNVERTAERE